MTIWLEALSRWLGRHLSFGDASVLVALIINGETGEERLHEMADWHFQRLLNTARACVGTSVTFLTGLLVSQFKDEFEVERLWIVLAAIGAAAVAAFGLLAYRRVRRQNDLYAACLLIVKLLRSP